MARGASWLKGWPREREAATATATYFPNFLLRREDFGEELQVDLPVLWMGEENGLCTSKGLWTVISCKVRRIRVWGGFPSPGLPECVLKDKSGSGPHGHAGTLGDPTGGASLGAGWHREGRACSSTRLGPRSYGPQVGSHGNRREPALGNAGLCWVRRRRNSHGRCLWQRPCCRVASGAQGGAETSLRVQPGAPLYAEAVPLTRVWKAAYFMRSLSRSR